LRSLRELVMVYFQYAAIELITGIFKVKKLQLKGVITILPIENLYCSLSVNIIREDYGPKTS
jgi:hypothetical protein